MHQNDSELQQNCTLLFTIIKRSPFSTPFCSAHEPETTSRTTFSLNCMPSLGTDTPASKFLITMPSVPSVVSV